MARLAGAATDNVRASPRDDAVGVAHRMTVSSSPARGRQTIDLPPQAGRGPEADATRERTIAALLSERSFCAASNAPG